MLIGFQKALQHMPELRILHLRQRNLVYLEMFDFVHTTPGSIDYHTHRWANAFFDYLHERQWSSKLTALVVHCRVNDDSYADDMDEYDLTPQHCYIKGFQTSCVCFGKSLFSGANFNC
jgi:hypothetical protein